MQDKTKNIIIIVLSILLTASVMLNIFHPRPRMDMMQNPMMQRGQMQMPQGKQPRPDNNQDNTQNQQENNIEQQSNEM